MPSRPHYCLACVTPIFLWRNITTSASTSFKASAYISKTFTVTIQHQTVLVSTYLELQKERNSTGILWNHLQNGRGSWHYAWYSWYLWRWLETTFETASVTALSWWLHCRSLDVLSLSECLLYCRLYPAWGLWTLWNWRRWWSLCPTDCWRHARKSYSVYSGRGGKQAGIVYYDISHLQYPRDLRPLSHGHCQTKSNPVSHLWGVECRFTN